MHRYWPETRLRIRVALRKRVRAHVFLMLLPGASLMCMAALTARPAGAQDGAAPPAAAAPADAPGARACVQCHGEIARSVESSPHASIAAGKDGGGEACEGCHGAGHEKGSFANAKRVNAMCSKCHTEKAGPFAHEHAAVKAEGCTGCHDAHGSGNARLLKAQSINELCGQCHSPAMGAAAHGHGEGPQAKTCTSCHTHIHGSNGSAAFLN